MDLTFGYHALAIFMVSLDEHTIKLELWWIDDCKGSGKWRYLAYSFVPIVCLWCIQIYYKQDVTNPLSTTHSRDETQAMNSIWSKLAPILPNFNNSLTQ